MCVGLCKAAVGSEKMSRPEKYELDILKFTEDIVQEHETIQLLHLRVTKTGRIYDSGKREFISMSRVSTQKIYMHMSW